LFGFLWKILDVFGFLDILAIPTREIDKFRFNGEEVFLVGAVKNRFALKRIGNADFDGDFGVADIKVSGAEVVVVANLVEKGKKGNVDMVNVAGTPGSGAVFVGVFSDTVGETCFHRRRHNACTHRASVGGFDDSGFNSNVAGINDAFGGA